MINGMVTTANTEKSIRKKVPYIPTPKDDTEEQSLGINLPNTIVLCLSLAAIGYGLYNDWNPFTITMAAICSINCFFMVFMLMASQQLKVRSYQKKHQKLSAVSSNIGAFKRKFWFFRRRIYSGIRSVSLLLIILSVCVAVYVSRRADQIDIIPARPNHKNVLLTGIFEPAKTGDGLTDMSRVSAVQRASKTSFDIISIYLPWGDQPQCAIPTTLMENIYSNHSTPMITWEPWQNLFKAPVKHHRS